MPGMRRTAQDVQAGGVGGERGSTKQAGTLLKSFDNYAFITKCIIM